LKKKERKINMPEDILLYPFGNKMRILCTNRILWSAMLDDMMLFQSLYGGYYWATNPRRFEDTAMATPHDFWVKKLDGSVDMNRARTAAPGDYFLLRRG